MVTAEKVRETTNQIKAALNLAGELLQQVRDGRHYEALDYTSFSAYVAGELGFSRSKAYRMMREAQVNSEVSRARDKLSQRAAVELARFPEELQVVIAATAESYTVSQDKPRTARDIAMVGEIVTQMVSSGHVDTGGDEMSAFNAAMVQEESERLARMRQHIADSYAGNRTWSDRFVVRETPVVINIPVEWSGKTVGVKAWVIEDAAII